MDSTTSDQPPATGVLEQFGTWLDALPPVPPWLQWIAFWLAIVTAVGVPTVMFLWRRWGANWWAGRSRAGAESQAARLAENVIRSIALSRDRPAMLSLAVRVLTLLIGCCTFAIMGLITGLTRYAPMDFEGLPSQDVVEARNTLSVVFILMAYVCGVFFNIRARRLVPLRNIDKFAQRSRSRIVALFTKAGVPDEIAAKRLTDLDKAIDAVRKQEIR